MNRITATATTTLKYSALAASISLLASCAATSVAIEHRSLETQTQLSKTIFLDPVASSQKTMFISVKNTSDQAIDISQPLASAFRSHGYKVVNNPAQAHYILQANILKVGKMAKSASQSALGGGFGSSIAGAATGAALGSFSSNSNAMLAGGVVGGVAGLVADSLVKNVNFTMITDIKITETGHAKHPYYTRIVSNADKVNLSFPVARPALEAGLVNTLVGIF